MSDRPKNANAVTADLRVQLFADGVLVAETSNLEAWMYALGVVIREDAAAMSATHPTPSEPTPQ